MCKISCFYQKVHNSLIFFEYAALPHMYMYVRIYCYYILHHFMIYCISQKLGTITTSPLHCYCHCLILYVMHRKYCHIVWVLLLLNAIHNVKFQSEVYSKHLFHQKGLQILNMKLNCKISIFIRICILLLIKPVLTMYNIRILIYVHDFISWHQYCNSTYIRMYILQV